MYSVAGVKGRGRGRVRKRRRRDDKRSGDWVDKEGNACYNNPLFFTSADAGVRKFWLVNQTIEQACSANQTGDPSCPASCCSMTSPLGFKINTLSWVFGFPVISSLLLTIIGQNIGILSSECKWGVFVNVSINFRFCVRRIAHVELSENKFFIELSFPGLFSFSCSPSDSRYFFITSLPSGVIVVGSCLLLRSFSASQCNFSMKLYSSDAFLILQTCFDKFSFLDLVYNGNPTEPQQWAKISLALSTLPDGEKIFKWDSSFHRNEVNSTKSKISVFLNVCIGFPSPFTNFCLSRRHSVAKIFSCFRRYSHVKSVMRKSALLILIGEELTAGKLK